MYIRKSLGVFLPLFSSRIVFLKEDIFCLSVWWSVCDNLEMGEEKHYTNMKGPYYRARTHAHTHDWVGVFAIFASAPSITTS